MKKFKNYLLSLTILFSSYFALGMHKPVWFAAGLTDGNIVMNELQKDGTCKVIKKVDRNSDPNAHTYRISALAYDNKKGFLFSGSWDNTIKVWHVEDGSLEYLQTIDKSSDSNAHTGLVSALVYDSEKGLLFSSSDNNTIKVWHIVDSKPFDPAQDRLKHLQTIENAHTDFVYVLAYDNKKGFLFSGSWDNTIKVWHMVDGSLKNLQTIEDAHTDCVLVLAYDSNKSLLFSGSDDNIIKVWHMIDGTLKYLQTIENAHIRCVRALVYNSTKDLLFSCSDDNTIKVWHMVDSTLKHLQTIKDAHTRCVEALVYDSTKDLLFSCSDDNIIKVWYMIDGKLKHLQTIDMQLSGNSLIILDDNEQKEIAQQDLKERVGFLANNLKNLFFTQEQEVKKINIDRFTPKATTLFATNILLFN